MKTIIPLIQIILSVLLTALILLQNSTESESRSNLLSTQNFEKRGWEKAVFTFTIVIAALFIISSLIQAII